MYQYFGGGIEMAKLIPSFEQIQNSKPKPTMGEMNLLRLLVQYLNDDYYIYFQSYLNGYRPDVVVIKEGCGVFIIEVKDWDLEHYNYLPQNSKQLYGNLQLKKNGAIIKSPFDQVKAYKDCLYELYLPELTYQNMINTSMYGAIKIGVYFDQAKQKSVDEMFGETKHVSKWGCDNKDIIKDIEYMLSYENRLSPSILNDIKRLLEPKYHKASEGREFTLSADQQRMVKSVPGRQQKLLGLAGSGKTTVIAYRAVNVVKRLNGNARVLIVTFNITLRNYIKDKISLIREDFSWSNFNIIHFHVFIKQAAAENNIPFCYDEMNDGYSMFLKNLDIKVFEGKVSESSKYDAIIIDEGQDFERKWFDVLKKCFLKENGEFLIVADEKQNIYNKKLDTERKIETNIRGQWNRLKTSHRMDSLFMRLAQTFQQSYFNNKYELDETNQQEISFEMEQQSFLYYRTRLNAEPIVNHILQFIKDKGIHENDCCILSNKIEFLREMEFIFRKQKYMKTETVFETKEEFEKIQKIHNYKKEKELDKLRRTKKFAFYNNSGKIKLSTIHSFKGWENDHIFLILDSDNNLNDELLYTAITRCKKTLIIYDDSNNNNYYVFFTRFINNEKVNDPFDPF